MPSRNYGLDILKIIAICLVCSYHFSILGATFLPIDNYTIGNIAYNLINMVNSMCIPIFFMVNGALLLNKEVYIKKHIKKSIVLLFSFFVWRIITILIIAVHNNVDFSQMTIGTIVNSFFLLEDFPTVDLSHLWFIPTLLSLYTIYPFFSFAFFKEDKKINYIYFFVLLLFVFMLIGGDAYYIQHIVFKEVKLNFDNLDKFFPFDQNRCGYIFYFLLGGVFVKNKEKLMKIKFRILVPTFLLGLTMLFTYKHFQPGLWDYVFGGYNLLPTILMTSSLFAVCLKIPNEKIEKRKYLSKPIKLVGSNTITIYYTHWIVGYTIFITNLYPHVGQGFINNSIKVFAFVIIGTICGAILRKIPIIKLLVN